VLRLLRLGIRRLSAREREREKAARTTGLGSGPKTVRRYACKDTGKSPVSDYDVACINS